MNFFKRIIQNSNILLKLQDLQKIMNALEKDAELNMNPVLLKLDELKRLEMKVFQMECQDKKLKEKLNGWSLEELPPQGLKSEYWIHEIKNNPHAYRLHWFLMSTALIELSVLSVHKSIEEMSLDQKEDWIQTYDELREQMKEALNIDRFEGVFLSNSLLMIRGQLEYLTKQKSFMLKSMGQWNKDQWIDECRDTQTLKNDLMAACNQSIRNAPNVQYVLDLRGKMSAWHERLQVEFADADDEVKVREYGVLIHRCAQEVERVARHVKDAPLKEKQKAQILETNRNSFVREFGGQEHYFSRKAIAPSMQPSLIKAFDAWIQTQNEVSSPSATLKLKATL